MKTLYKMNNVCKHVGAMGKALALAVVMLAFGNSAYAWTIQAGDYYFDNTQSNWDKVYIRYGKSGDGRWVEYKEMSKVVLNAKLYCYHFENNIDNVTTIQFAAVDGFIGNDYNDIYDGNRIDPNKKTGYMELGGDWVPGFPLTVAFSDHVDGYTKYVSGAPMPSSVTATIRWGGSNGIVVGNGTTLGYYVGGTSVNVWTQATMSYNEERTNDCISATLNYNVDGSTVNSMYGFSTNDNHTKTGSANIALSTTVGKHQFVGYVKSGGPASTQVSGYYHMVGLTGKDLNFGALRAGAKKSLTESLSNVWAGDGATSVSAVISGGVASHFSFSEETPTTEATIDITNKAGSATIYFTAPDAKGTYTETLTLTLTYNTNKTLVKTYTLTGSVVPDDPTVMLGAEPVYLNGPKATLSGYLKLAACNNDIETAGIVWGTSTNPTIGGSGCANIECITGDTPIAVGTSWSGTTDSNFSKNTTYHYRAYVIDTNTGVPYYSPDGTFIYSSDCVYPLVNDTVYIKVDRNFAADDDCALEYQELQTAVTKIKALSFLYNSSTKKLNHHIVVQVAYHAANYKGTGTTTKTGGDATDLSTIIFEDINNTQTPEKVLIVRASNPANPPTIQHPTIRNSKNITFENVYIYGSSSPGLTSKKYDNAIDIDSGDTGWTGLKSGAVANANINFRNCEITSLGFTCVHAAAYDGITFENCVIDAELDDNMKADPNTSTWGASVKFIQCKNIKFLRNNFRGSHATSMWLQGVIGFLAMNNVFWNDNDAYNSTYPDNGTFIRLVTQQKDGSDETKSNKNDKIGIYYNTLYIAENENVEVQRHFDFFRLGRYYDYGGRLNSNLELNIYGNIRFMYNNCYSYDQSSVIGCNQSGDNKWCLTDTESNWCQSIHHNNYWSMKESCTPNFVIPNASACSSNVYYNVNVYEQVCSAGAEDPASLVIKGGDLNLGQHITTDVSGLGGEALYNDRLHASNGSDAVRKTNGKWTIGAYQQGEADTPVDVIVWWGDAKGDGTNWDNRFNWRKLDGSRVTCIDNFASDLKVIIPAPESEVYKTPAGGIKKYPLLPDKFDGTRTKNTQETVNAGHGISNPSKFAGTIELEYGGAIKNVEALKDDEARRYTEVNTSFTAGRKEWILVGTVVMPFDGNKEKVRLVQSGDYFIADHMPHVYMHEASFDQSKATASWLTPFTQLDEEVPYDRVFAIKIPDQYGPYKLPAATYAEYFGIGDPEDGTRSKTFNFNGWFLNDEVIPEYKITGNIIMSNTYPATLDVATTESENHGSVKYYDYGTQSFKPYDSALGDKDIKPQGGFIFVPGDGNDGWFRITPAMITDRNTKYKSAENSKPYLELVASNPDGEDGTSSVLIVNDELKANEYVQGPDLIKTTIAGMPTKPEVYAVMYGKELDKLTVPTFESAIPLGLKLERAMTVEFTIPTMGGIEKAILEDRGANKSYDLLKGEKGSIALAAGTYAGRFYLNLGTEKQDVPTEEDPVVDESSEISIYAQEDGTVVISAPLSENLKSAEITDLGGVTRSVPLKDAHYNRIKIDGVQGAYVVKAIGEAQSKTAKVIVK